MSTRRPTRPGGSCAASCARDGVESAGTNPIKMKQQRISGKEAVQVAEDMAKPGPIRVVAASEAQDAPGALVPSPGSELERKMPPRVRKPLPRNDQWKAPTPDLEGHRKRLREALGNTLSDEFVDVILGKLVEALRPGLYDQLEEATLNAALATIDSMQPRSELQAILAVQIIATSTIGLRNGFFTDFTDFTDLKYQKNIAEQVN